jgi:hypothetical protein
MIIFCSPEIQGCLIGTQRSVLLLSALARCNIKPVWEISSVHHWTFSQKKIHGRKVGRQTRRKITLALRSSWRSGDEGPRATKGLSTKVHCLRSGANIEKENEAI